MRQNLYADISGVKGSSKCKAYSLHDCKAKDTHVWKSTTYIAKLQQLRLQHGYTNTQIALILKMGRKWGNLKGPIYKQIIALYQLDNDSYPEDVIQSIFEYHEIKEKPTPTLRRCKELSHAIMMQISSVYRANVKLHLVDFIVNGTLLYTEAEASQRFKPTINFKQLNDLNSKCNGTM